jgi:hypothetical protein
MPNMFLLFVYTKSKPLKVSVGSGPVKSAALCMTQCAVVCFGSPGYMGGGVVRPPRNLNHQGETRGIGNIQKIT